MLKERDYDGILRMLQRSNALTADDMPGASDNAEDLRWCNTVLNMLGDLRRVIAAEALENDGDDVSTWAAETLDDVDDMISDVQDLINDLMGDMNDTSVNNYSPSPPPGYVPG